MQIRDAVPEDWPAIWSFMRQIVAAGETFVWDRDISEARARAFWFPSPGRTVVAVEAGAVVDAGSVVDAGGVVDAGSLAGTGTGTGTGTVVGTAELAPNFGGPGSHIANAGFMVDPAHAGRGIGRALARHVIATARADGYRAMQFNAVVETNTTAVALWRSLGFEVLATVPEAFQHPVKGFVGLHIMYLRL